MGLKAYCREGHLLTVEKRSEGRYGYLCHCEPCGDMAELHPTSGFGDTRVYAVAEYVANHGGSVLSLPESFTALQALEFCHRDRSILTSPAKMAHLLEDLAASQYAAGILRGREIATEREDE
jgi:hypothetical protein